MIVAKRFGVWCLVDEETQEVVEEFACYADAIEGRDGLQAETAHLMQRMAVELIGAHRVG